MKKLIGGWLNKNNRLRLLKGSLIALKGNYFLGNKKMWHISFTRACKKVQVFQDSSYILCVILNLFQDDDRSYSDILKSY